MGGLGIFALIVLVVLAAAALVIWVVLAMLPGKIAKHRNHPQADAINVGGWLGALLGGVLWPLVLVWAFTMPRPPTMSPADDSGKEVDTLKERVAALEAKLVSRQEGAL